MFIPYTHDSIRLTGRWDVTDPNYAVATPTGSYLEFAFEGRTALARFDTTTNRAPYLHLWIQVDGGPMCEAPIDYALRVCTRESGFHTVRIIYKGGMEESERWYPPLHGKVCFLGVQLEKPAPLPPDNRKTIEFVGDSITEGVFTDIDYYEGFPRPLYDTSQLNRQFQDDVCATYAWLTAEDLNLRPFFMGYGAVGATKGGCGGVPSAPEAYSFNFHDSPVTYPPCDIVVINHGANDRRGKVENYLVQYEKLLDIVRARNPHALIVSLSAFVGFAHTELGEMIADYNQRNGCDVRYIDSFGWIPPEPLHPMRDGHRIVAGHLVPLLKKIIG